jgi:hypothetical protein
MEADILAMEDIVIHSVAEKSALPMIFVIPSPTDLAVESAALRLPNKAKPQDDNVKVAAKSINMKTDFREKIARINTPDKEALIALIGRILHWRCGQVKVFNRLSKLSTKDFVS